MTSAERITPWKLLLVDDEPAVHEVSRLILAGLSFEGRNVELLSAESAARARDMLDHHADFALVLLDVVMETDDAGLALVHYIREQLRNIDVQIVLRTGQPGVAPEADIMRSHEINGYFLKTEITAQRLHSIVITALRGYRHALSLRSARDGGQAHVVPRIRDDAWQVLAQELARLDEREAVYMTAQPEVSMATGEVVGIELVPLWKTSQGLLAANRVRDARPDAPVLARMTRWLLAQAAFWTKAWRTRAGRDVKVSIPWLGEALDDCDILDAVLTAARDGDHAACSLDLLVSESTLLSGAPGVRASVAALRGVGISVTLVDFGAQTISLQRLNDVVPDRLKIHRLFVRGVVHEPERMALARSLIALAQTLNIVSIADGVSSDADAQFFKWEGCDLGQGDALAPACAPIDVAAFLEHGRRAAH